MIKQILLTSVATFTFFSGIAQIDDVVLDGNGVAVDVSNKGSFFNSTSDGPGYEFPKGSANHLIYSNSLWFGGVDINGNLKLAANKYPSEENNDLFKGALTDDGLATAGVPPEQAEVYKVSQAEIDYHIAHAGEAGYIMPHGILNWPAHGNVGENFDYYLTSFEDVDGNGVYEPETGDYPTIRGDHATYLILNDKGGIHTSSGGDPLGIEVHFMFYQYESDDFIDSTTFVHVEVINRGTQFFPEFVVANFMDFDIGFGGNDYVGSNEENDVVYGYNGTVFDEGTGGGPGFGGNPPALGLVTLNHPLHVGGTYSASAGAYGEPESASDYWGYMNGIWKNGIPFQYGGNGSTTASDSTVRYMYSGNPAIDGEDEWTEVGVSNPPGDRRVFAASEAVALNVGDALCYDYAFIATQSGGDHIANVASIIEMAADVKEFYAAQTNNNCGSTLSAPEFYNDVEALIYPNPSSGQFAIEMVGEYDVNIFGMDGRLVYQENKLNGTQVIDENLAKGQYIVQINQGEKTIQEKLIIQ